MTIHKHIPEIPGPALLREGDITVERVREFAPGRHTHADFQTLEDALKNEVHTASE